MSLRQAWERKVKEEVGKEEKERNGGDKKRREEEGKQGRRK